MSNELRLSLRINGTQAAADMRRFTSGATADMQRFARNATAATQRFTSTASRGLGRMSNEVKALRQDFGGFSTATKLFAAAGGLETIRRTLNTNLNFERDLLEMKQNAGMSIKQVAELRKIAMDSAPDALQLPDAVVQGEKAYARAGMKFEEIKDSIAEAARSATVMRSTVEQIANMDFDLQSKFNISAKDMKAAHNMAYYHGNEGRFETASMAQLAPVYLNALKGVGVNGMKGWNFTGALTQSIMKSAPATEPSQVATLIQQGVGHIATYAKDLGKVGINVKKYGPGGQFGVEGLLKLAEVMKAKGLNDIFKLEKAGIRDQEAKKFWLQMMNDSGEIRKQMGVAEQAAQGDRIGADLAEIKTASFGKIMASEIQIQKLALSEKAQQGTTVAGNAAGYVSEHMGDVAKGAVAAGGLYLLSRFNSNRKTRLAGEAQSLAGAARSAAVQSVLVTNWPAGMLSVGERMGGGPSNRAGAGGAPVGNTGNEPPARSSGMGKAATALGAAGAAFSGWEIGQAIGGVAKELIDSTIQAVTGQESATLGTAIYDMLHKSKIDTGGELHIKIDSPTPVKVASMKSNDPRQTINVDAGPTMAGTR
ncbi:phage tail tape measure protein [Methylobacter tundripaludum]|uniref:phage tail tape measure protein n=1 Tax=Methylobacter tundripaludum TaxID=173365 RepID=UPI0004DEDF4C|nr:phage tail tape measure protein [Methylobacter tundripaludum]